jgi:HAD superfamily hydrolase (TIGR01490 family)
MTSRTRVALFDLDHTLLPIDSDFSWGEYVQAIGWADRDEFRRRNDAFYEQYKAGTLDMHEYVRFVTDAVRVRGREAAFAARERYMQEVILPNVRPEATQLVRSHQDAGDLVLIISATNEFVTTPIAEVFGIPELIATRLATGPDGWITGEIDGVPSLREGKITRFEEWMHARGLRWDAVETTFYSDSMNDVPLLERVDHPVATNPDPRLRALAAERGWRILDLFPLTA